MTTTKPRDDWESWVADWHTVRSRALANDAALRRRVHAHGRRMVWLTVSEVLFSIGVVAVGLYLLVERSDTASVLWAAESVILLAVVWTFAIWNRRGTWRPLAETTDAFLELARLRCVRQLRTVRFVVIVLLVQLAALALWILRLGRTGAEGLTSADMVSAWLAVALVFGVFSLWAVWYWRRTRRELAVIDGLREELGAAPDLNGAARAAGP